MNLWNLLKLKNVLLPVPGMSGGMLTFVFPGGSEVRVHFLNADQDNEEFVLLTKQLFDILGLTKNENGGKRVELHP